MLTAGCGLEFLLVLCGLELSWSCPRHCICYTSPSTVSCQAHNFLTVPEGIPPASERIFLQNNKIHRLLRGHFSSDTVTLWIYSNNITYIEPSTFHGFMLLEELDLGDNRHLRSLAEDTFHGLSRLNALHLYRCGLSSLPNNIFQGLRNLQYLYLQVCKSDLDWFITVVTFQTKKLIRHVFILIKPNVAELFFVCLCVSFPSLEWKLEMATSKLHYLCILCPLKQKCVHVSVCWWFGVKSIYSALLTSFVHFAKEI